MLLSLYLGFSPFDSQTIYPVAACLSIGLSVFMHINSNFHKHIVWCMREIFLDQRIFITLPICLFVYSHTHRQRERERERERCTHTNIWCSLLCEYLIYLFFRWYFTQHEKCMCKTRARTYTQTLAQILPFTRAHPRDAMPTIVRPDSLSLIPSASFTLTKTCWRSFLLAYSQTLLRSGRLCVWARERVCACRSRRHKYSLLKTWAYLCFTYVCVYS